jgi:outer membrane protein OmpA-like peptidoglycan-associated protein
MTIASRTTASRMGARFMAVALTMTMAACASSTPTNPQLSRLEGQLKVAYADKYVAQYGKADLANAEMALDPVRKGRGNTNSAQHNMDMAEDYINLGEIHGRQERAKAEIAGLKVRQDQVRLASRDRDVAIARNDAAVSRVDAAASRIDTAQAEAATRAANQNADVSRADAAQAFANAALATQAANDKTDAARVETANAQAATQKAELHMADMRKQLAIYNLTFNDRGATLVLQDVMFDTDSAHMREGAVNRLSPLLTYLRSSPTTSVRIEGHTDSTGTSAHNDALSLDRANAVARALENGGQAANTIQTEGYGQSKPVASNDTVSGREQNRRVEITLLK